MEINAKRHLATLALLSAFAMPPQPGLAEAVSTAEADTAETMLKDLANRIALKWNVGAMGTDALKARVMLRVKFNRNGRPEDMALFGSLGPNEGAVQVAYQSARRAIMRAYIESEDGFGLPADRYHEWKVIDFVFDADGIRPVR